MIDLCCFGKRQLAALPSYELLLSLSPPLYLFLSLFLTLLNSFVCACFKNVCVPLLLLPSLSLCLPPPSLSHAFSYFLTLSTSLSLSFFLCILIIVSENLFSFSLLLALQAFPASAACDSQSIVIDSLPGSTRHRTLHFLRSEMPAESRFVCVCVRVFHVFFLSCASLSLSSNCLFSPFTFPAACPRSSQCNNNNSNNSKIKNKKTRTI